ncbi:MAG: hypothetical protein DMD82_15915 [Candidatus Rokuibacteriota bacterium]|nr:MAG: hypothetical protein DMD82_15915 [Candidatus Rokubacteria bacterium]
MPIACYYACALGPEPLLAGTHLTGLESPPGDSLIFGFGKKLLVYERHARQRMSQRNVTEEQVKAVLAAPDWSAPAVRPNARKFVKRIAGRSLTVIAESELGFVRVITVYWSTED